MEWVEFTGKNVDDALTEALISLETTSDKVEWEVIEKESKGVLGLFSRPARIRVRVKQEEKKEEEVVVKPQVRTTVTTASTITSTTVDSNIAEVARTFMLNVLKEMHVNAEVKVELKEGNQLDIDIVGEDKIKRAHV